MSRRKFSILFVFVILLIHLLCGLQYFNFCDEMFVVTSGQQIFQHPENVSYAFMYYLGAFVAGVWNYLFDWLGFYGFRILNAIVATANFYIVYRLLEKHVDRWYIFAGAILTMFAETHDLNMAIHHNSLTCLLTTCAACFFYKGLIKNSSRYLFISGAILGINVFTRLTNVALVGLIFALVPYSLYNREKGRILVRFIISAIAGFIVGVMIIIGLMVMIGHYQLFLDVVTMLFGVAKDADSGHGILSILPAYMQDYRIIALISVCTLLIFFTIQSVEEKLHISRLAICLITALLILIPFFYVYDKIPQVKIWHYYYAIVTIVFAYVLKYYSNKESLVYLSTLSILIIYLQPLGGDFGIGNMHSCSLRLALPFSIGVVGLIIDEHKAVLTYKCFSWFFIAVMMLWGANMMMRHKAWYDFNPEPRWKVTTMPKSPRLNVFLPADEAKLIDDVVEEISRLKGKFNSLQTNDMPVFNYITDIRPYLQCTTSDFYSPTMLKIQYSRAESIYGDELPILVFSHKLGSDMYHYDKNWNNTECMSPTRRKRYLVHKDFIVRHHYKEVWRKESFAILLPNMY